MAYHDLEDNLYGFPLGAQIEILQMKLRQYQGNDWQLQQLDLASIRSLDAAHPAAATIVMAGPWRLRTSAGQQRQ